MCSAIATQAEDSHPLSVSTAEVYANEELELLTEEETVSIATRYEQPMSQPPSNVYFITDEDIHHSGATAILTVLRHVSGLDVMEVTGSEFSISARGDYQLFANKLLVMVDGHSVYIDIQGLAFWKFLPVTLPDGPAIVSVNRKQPPTICMTRELPPRSSTRSMTNTRSTRSVTSLEDG